MSDLQREVSQREGRLSLPSRILRAFVGWFLDHLYTDLAWAYDLVANVTSVGQWWVWQRALDDALPAGPLLELGVGTGRLLHRYLAEGRQVYGVELSPQMISIARRRLQSSSLPPHLIQASAAALPFKPNAFHALFSTFPSDYILQGETLAEALRMLALGGELIVLPGAWITGRGPLDRLAHSLYRIAGQSPPTDLGWLEGINLPGIELEWHVVEQARARVLRLHLRPEGRSARPGSS